MHIIKITHCRFKTNFFAGASNGTFVRNSESCRAFYYCVEGTAHRNECPESYVFEPVRQLCDIPSRVDCTGKYRLDH